MDDGYTGRWSRNFQQRRSSKMKSLLTAALIAITTASSARSDDAVVSLLHTHCARCHGKSKRVEGDVNLATAQKDTDLLTNARLISDVIDVLEAEYMPPEDESSLTSAARTGLVHKLRGMLHTAVTQRTTAPRTPIRRMNRFQYNNAVQDLFQLNVVVFPLPERMMREHDNYFQPHTGKMPNVVRVGSRPLGKSQLIERRLGGVTAFPQDLRAENGFDNRGDHLSLSPLLLESFLQLSRSIVESPDFHEKTSGIWPEFFTPPADSQAQLEPVVRKRLLTFLTRAFRRPVEDELLDRYASYALAQIDAGTSFVDAMKSVASAALASPHFLYIYSPQPVDDSSQTLNDFDLATRLSFFLWGSIPDQHLLDLAADGVLNKPDVLAQQVDRMLGDRKLKRFCDSFPAQWLQLERIISSTPDREMYPQFYFSKYRASMHMMLEPLLLFETVLIENLSILNFIDSDFSYRSDLLNSWYSNGTQGKAGSPVSVPFNRVSVSDRRQGGVITSAAVMTMTSGPTRTHPITRGAWIASVILNDPPEPPPADVPPLAEKPAEVEKNLTIRERFAAHRTRPDCAACHRRIDPLGFALENYNAAGIWRDEYSNGRQVDASGSLFGRHEFGDIVEFKNVLLKEKHRFARAFTRHLLSFALGREADVADTLAVDRIVEQTGDDEFRFRELITQLVLSESFRR